MSTLTAHQLSSIAELLRELATDATRSNHEDCSCDVCSPKRGPRRDRNADAVDWAADLDKLALHTREVAAVGCRFEGCTQCHPQASKENNDAT